MIARSAANENREKISTKSFIGGARAADGVSQPGVDVIRLFLVRD